MKQPRIKPRDYMKRGYMGIVEIKAIDDDPESATYGQVLGYHKHNTITYEARKIMARALAGDEMAHIDAVGWGTGATAAQRTDIGAETQVITSTVIQPVSYPEDGASVIFSSTLPRGIGTGYTYSEVVLLTKDGKCFARFVFPGQFKFAQLRLSVNWQIIFI